MLITENKEWSRLSTIRPCQIARQESIYLIEIECESQFARCKVRSANTNHSDRIRQTSTASNVVPESVQMHCQCNVLCFTTLFQPFLGPDREAIGTALIVCSEPPKEWRADMNSSFLDFLAFPSDRLDKTFTSARHSLCVRPLSYVILYKHVVTLSSSACFDCLVPDRSPSHARSHFSRRCRARACLQPFSMSPYRAGLGSSYRTSSGGKPFRD